MVICLTSILDITRIFRPRSEKSEDTRREMQIEFLQEKNKENKMRWCEHLDRNRLLVAALRY